ncbi:hypothetical protein DACRYDRAFT_24510 [Dacryopinax primogenitus]|uniref:S-adenosyl-L-methionine-dependent methyltransferase n=1 Tax=Dacryopinax primogenitus (strain DJM 731) TaxID=1858805 RepID=M5FRT2_DACPD|nr:uncharacterized protein DACRYDRAFT_24510 [Dacryopinax primogenitus]EJT98463.1 hypothetical protein DACRYDRAFT_24510 [Dacryopinax primogenitus]
MATTATLTLSSPSSSLPPLKQLQKHTPALLALSIRALAQLYHPGSTASAPSKFVDSGYSSAPNPAKTSDARESEVDEEWERLRADSFEREWAMRWLLELISRGEDWAESCGEGEEGVKVKEDKERVLEDAAALLAACSKTSEAGTLRREYSFPVDDGRCIKLSTRDEAYAGDDHTAVGVQTWASSTILAEMFARSPAEYGFPFGCSAAAATLGEGYSAEKPCQILEIGAGTGVLSLLLAALSTEHNAAHVPTEIVASDYHPTVLSNLSSNLLSNFPTQPPWVTLACDRLDWSVFASSEGVMPLLDPPFDDKFDIIVGADIVYEPAHCAWIYATVRALLAPGGQFHLIMPQRITHEVETAMAREMFREKPGGQVEKVLGVTRYIETERWAGKGRADEVRYMIWRMEWV